MVKTTRAQRVALWRIFTRDFPSWQTPTWRNPIGIEGVDGNMVRVPSLQWRRFRKTVTPYFDNSGCVMVPFHGMWLGIETDGYTHS